MLEGSPKPLKVMVATSYGTGKEAVPEDELNRLFIRVGQRDLCNVYTGQFPTCIIFCECKKKILILIQIPEEFTEDDIHHHFGQFGGIEFVNMVMDKETGKHKGGSCGFLPSSFVQSDFFLHCTYARLCCYHGTSLYRGII